MLNPNTGLHVSRHTAQRISTQLMSLFLAVTTSALAQETAPAPSHDPSKRIAAALASAKRDGKFVLLDFGASWCPDCRVFWTLLKDSVVSRFVEKNFHYVEVDVGRRDKNMDIAEQYRAPVPKWIPSVAILDPSGNVTAISGDGMTRGPQRITTRTTASEVNEYLRLWSPKQKMQSLHEFSDQGARVEVMLEKDSDGQAWLAAAFRPIDAGSYVYSKDMPADGVDGLGRPIRLSIVSTDGAKAMGPSIADRVVEEKKIEALNQVIPSYPPGPVTLRFPISLPSGCDPTRAELVVSYMVCGAITGCQPPVEKRITVELPRPR